MIDLESITRTSISPSKALAAFCADCIVAESSLDRLMQTTASAPSAAALRNASSNAPGDGAAVSGSASDGRHPAIEVADAQLLAIDELFGPESDRERHHLDPVGGGVLDAEVTGTVGDDAYSGHDWRA